MLREIVRRVGEITFKGTYFYVQRRKDVQRRWKGGLQSCGRYGKLMLAGDVANTQQQLKSAVIHPEFGGRKEAACV